MGGEGDGTNPEQLVAVGDAACCAGWRRPARSRSEERTYTLAVDLNVTLPLIPNPEEAPRIVAAAHLECPHSNATRGNIQVKLTANGREV